MKIVPERVTVLPDLQSGEFTVIMDGYRLNLNPEEARLLGYALLQATKHLPSELPRPSAAAHSVATATFPAKPAVSVSSDAAKAAVDEAAKDVVRSISA
jgi:hypothetical protein